MSSQSQNNSNDNSNNNDTIIINEIESNNLQQTSNQEEIQ